MSRRSYRLLRITLSKTDPFPQTFTSSGSATLFTHAVKSIKAWRGVTVIAAVMEASRASRVCSDHQRMVAASSWRGNCRCCANEVWNSLLSSCRSGPMATAPIDATMAFGLVLRVSRSRTMWGALRVNAVSVGQRKSPRAIAAGLNKEPMTFRVMPGEEGEREGGDKSQARLKRVDGAAA